MKRKKKKSRIITQLSRGFPGLDGIPDHCIVSGEKSCSWNVHDLEAHSLAMTKFAIKFAEKVKGNLALQFQEEYSKEILNPEGINLLQLDQSHCTRGHDCTHNFTEDTKKVYFNALCGFLEK